MSGQVLLVCDDEGRPTGELVAKEIAHTGDGRRHVAISISVARSDGSILLQRRKHPIFDDIWDLAGATHPLWLGDGVSESFEAASDRCFEVEYGVPAGSVQWSYVGGYAYFVRDDVRCENEFCHLLTTVYDGDLRPNDQVAYDTRWIAPTELWHWRESEPSVFAEWAILSIDLLHARGDFG